MPTVKDLKTKKTATKTTKAKTTKTKTTKTKATTSKAIAAKKVAAAKKATTEATAKKTATKTTSIKNAIVDSTLYGGKPSPDWENEEFRLPGYQNCRIVFQHVRKVKTMYTWGFMVSPNSLNITYGQDIQTQKTAAGWFIDRHGPAMGQVSFSGVLLDTYRCPERLKLLDVFNGYTENQNNFNEFDSNYSQYIIIEGIKYFGLIQSINLSKAGERPYVYQYSISFLFYKSKRVYSYPATAMTADQIRKQTGVYTKRDYIDQSTGVLTASKISIEISPKMANLLRSEKLLDK